MDDGDNGSSMVASAGTIALLNESEINQQIATAHKYPRSLKRFRDEVLQMVTLNESIAGECVYALPRKEKDKATGQWVTKTIEGPSARFAEIVASAWGNSRAGARVVSDDGDFVTAQGVMHDLERNLAITFEVQRRIVDSNGRRYKLDMIGVTANAASSIALRNAILKVVPKAFWADLYQAARETIMGDFKTLANRRSDALKEFQKFGVQPGAVYAKLGIAGIEDVTLEHLLTLRGLLTALRDGDTTPEQAFDADGGERVAPVVPRKSDAQGAVGNLGAAAGPAANGQPSGPGLADAASAIAGINGVSPVEVLRDAVDAAGGVGTSTAMFDQPGPGMATGGERQLILSKVKSKRLDLLTVLDEHKVTSLQDPMTLQGLTSTDFQKLRTALA